MYYNHKLRTDLQEWKNYLYKINYKDYKDEFRFFFQKLDKEKQILSILNNVIDNYPLKEEDVSAYMKSLSSRVEILYENKEHKLSYSIHLCNWLISNNKTPYDYNFFGKSITENWELFIDRIITPIVNYLHESLDNISYILYILEKYKLRTEWFTKDILRDKYKNVLNRQYEQVLEDDIRLYLFDQGIDYPFSTPKSASGRADVVSLVNTEDPLVMEIKIYDSERKYGKERIISGFTQIVKYANDYHKNVGYLVVFNLDEIEIKIENIEPDNKFPSRVIFNGKTYYIIVVNLNYDTSASNLKKLNKITIAYNELTYLKEESSQ